ncbi:MAG: SDR family NAD(P)-dependent oxidoreductase [Prosthecobacter sp.]|nr:SDR family NAD(P)-dependent oxidoreductase [Prosthecobacter sp.]
MSSPTSRTWFITGCSSGLGRAIAEAALLAGDNVQATARKREDLELLEHLGAGRCQGHLLDVTDAAQARRVLREAAENAGRIDVLVNNAGYGLVGAVEECTDDLVRQNFETNFFGTLNVIQAALPILRGQKSGHLITISAAAAVANYAGFGIYGAAKAAVEALHESLRAELLPHGLKVTLVQPGPFRTDFIRRSLVRAPAMPEYAGSAGKFANYLSQVDGKQPGDPERAAELIVKMVQEGQSPLRLPLGRYITQKIRATATARLRELETWEQAACGVDFPS